jgi:antiviral helicase SKI2
MLDIDSQAVMPMWPLQAESLLVDDGVYELRIVPTTSISLISDRVVKASWTSQPFLFLRSTI